MNFGEFIFEPRATYPSAKVNKNKPIKWNVIGAQREIVGSMKWHVNASIRIHLVFPRDHQQIL